MKLVSLCLFLSDLEFQAGPASWEVAGHWKENGQRWIPGPGCLSGKCLLRWHSRPEWPINKGPKWFRCSSTANWFVFVFVFVNQQGAEVVLMSIHYKLICLCLCRSTGGKVVAMSIQCKLISNLLSLALTFTWAPLAGTDNHDTMQYRVLDHSDGSLPFHRLTNG